MILIIDERSLGVCAEIHRCGLAEIKARRGDGVEGSGHGGKEKEKERRKHRESVSCPILEVVLTPGTNFAMALDKAQSADSSIRLGWKSIMPCHAA